MINSYFVNGNLKILLFDFFSFVKPSFYNFKGNKFHNERLEFLGDAVLDLEISTSLFNKLTTSEPGPMTKLHHLITNNDTLNHIGYYLGFEDLILGNSQTQNNPNADSLEAFIGGLYLDQGLNVAKKFIQKYIFSKANELIENSTPKMLKYFQQHTFETESVKKKVELKKIHTDLNKIKEFEKKIGFEFKNKYIILEALTHGRSFEENEYRKNIVVF